jgi:energy-converting hydrogenase Eha subunit C
MEKMLELWLNPINLGILFVCITGGIWILAHSAPTNKD